MKCKRWLLVVCAALGAAGCGTWEIEPLPPDERGPQVQVPGGDTDPSPGGNTDPSPDAPGRVAVLVNRLDCPACADVLATRLRGVSGVGSVWVDLKSGRAVVVPAPGRTLSGASLRAAAEAGNFTVRGVQAQ